MNGSWKVVIALAAAVAAGGCAMNPYQDDTACQGYLDEGKCRDLLETYEDTHDYDREAYREALRRQAENGKGEAPIEAAESRIVGYKPLVDAEEQPMPMLRQAVAVRVWIAPYEDSAGKLHVPGYVYARATEPEWIFGEKISREARVALPLVRD